MRTKNFELDYKDIESIELKKFSKRRGGKNYFGMIIKSAKKRNFLVNTEFYDDLKSLLSEVMPEKLIAK